MWGTVFVVGMWLTPTPVINTNIIYADSLYHWRDTTSLILVEFSEPMSTDSLLYVNNYKLYDSTNTSIKIYKIGIVKVLDGDTVKHRTVIALIAKRIDVKKAYSVQVFNVRDLAGNVIGEDNEAWFYFNGYKPSFEIPTPKLRR